MMPQAREDGLLVQELPDETMVYDLNRHRAHCLNQTAALVWRHCDGRTTVEEMARLLQHELNIPAAAEVVWLALDRLGTAHLLRQRMNPPAGVARCSRREAMRRLGLAGGLSVLLPAVASIIAPTAAEAVSCVLNCAGQPNGRPCGPPQCAKTCHDSQCV